MIKSITNFLIIVFIFQQLKSQISQIDQNGYNAFCDETLHLFICAHRTGGLLSRKANLADPKSKSAAQNQAEYMKAVLRDNRGAAFLVDPSTGVLGPFSTLEVTVTAFSDMWGRYTDELICQVCTDSNSFLNTTTCNRLFHHFRIYLKATR